jgi:hypothetical protein
MKLIVSNERKSVPTRRHCRVSPVESSECGFCWPVPSTQDRFYWYSRCRCLGRCSSTGGVARKTLSINPGCFQDGNLPAIKYETEGHGVWCQHEGHLGSFHNIDTVELICNSCKKSGPPFQDGVIRFWPVQPLVPTKSLANCFFIVLVTRSSSGKAIPSKLFQNLRQCVIDNFR